MYAVLLGFALVSIVASAILVLLRRLSVFRDPVRKKWLSIFGGITSFLGMFASVLAAIRHFVGDHNEFSANPMKPAMFFAEHPAILVLSTLAIILSILHARS
jgi:hypothetical protein